MAGKIELDIIGNDKASGVLRSIGGSLSLLAGAATAAVGAAVFAVGSLLADSVKEAMAAEEAMAQLESVIKSTGGAAGITAEDASKLAESLSMITRFSDDAIVAGESLLLQFFSIGKEVFPDATKAMLDLATRGKMGVEQAARLIGKAMEGETGALKRFGIIIDDTTQKEIDGLFAAGKTAEAQKLILDQLNKSIGGAAEAAGKTFAGQLDILKNRLDNVKERIGFAVIPILTKLVDKVIVPAIPVIEKLADKFIAFIDAVGESKELQQVASFLSGMVASLANADTSFAPLIERFSWISDWWNENGAGIMASAEQMRAALVDTFNQIAESAGPFIDDILTQLQAWFVENGPLIQEYIQLIADNFTNYLLPAIVVLWNVVKPILSGLFTIILDLVKLVMQVATGDWAGAWQTILNIITTAASSIWDAIVALFEGIAGMMGTSMSEIGAIWSQNWTAFVQIIQTVAQNIVNGVATAFATMKNAIVTKFNEIVAYITGLKSRFIELGKNLMLGLVAGIVSAAKQVVAAVQNVVDDALGGANDAAETQSPSKKTAWTGRMMSAGLAQGIMANAQLPVRAMSNVMGQTLSSTYNNIYGPVALTMGSGGNTELLRVR